jgi:hypothetical protein
MGFSNKTKRIPAAARKSEISVLPLLVPVHLKLIYLYGLMNLERVECVMCL